MSQLQIMPTSGALGAEVRGVDLRHALDAATVVQLQTAFHDHCLLLFRHQQLTKADQVRFSRYFIGTTTDLGGNGFFFALNLL